MTIAFSILIEGLSLANLASYQMRGDLLWARSVAAKIIAGQRVGPHDDGPFDFRMFWSVGRMARAGDAAETYRPTALHRFEAQRLTISDPWIYPPVTIMAAVFAGLAGFVPAFVLWTLSLTLLSVLVLRWAHIPWPVVLATLISPAVLWNDNLGQIGLISGSMFIASLMMLENRQVRAGLLMGLVIIKPQAGLLGPVVFLARRRYLAVAVATAIVALMILLSVLLFGVPVWRVYLHQGLAVAHVILVAPFPSFGEPWGVSIFWMWRSLGFSVTVSYVAQCFGAIVAMIWCWRTWRDDRTERVPRIALTAFLTLFMTPYGYTDDMCAFSIAIGLLAWHRGEIGVIDGFIWAWPAFCANVSISAHVDITPIVVLVAALQAQEMLREPSRQCKMVDEGTAIRSAEGGDTKSQIME